MDEFSLYIISRRSSTTTHRQNNGTAVPCFVSTCLELNAASSATGKGEILTEELIKDSAAVAYAAGADTSVSTLTTFFLAMTLHPEAQKRAQAELDVVVGDRLPTFADKESLPYVTSLMKEVLRWIPVLPMAVPHRAVKSDQYKGYFIPAGASVLGNTWYAVIISEAVFSVFELRLQGHSSQRERIFGTGEIQARTLHRERPSGPCGSWRLWIWTSVSRLSIRDYSM